MTPADTIRLPAKSLIPQESITGQFIFLPKCKVPCYLTGGFHIYFSHFICGFGFYLKLWFCHAFVKILFYNYNK